MEKKGNYGTWVHFYNSCYNSADPGLDASDPQVPKYNNKSFFHMDTRQKLFAIGIVTRNRPAQLLRLLRNLNEQTPFPVDVFIDENGSNNITGASLKSFARLHSTLMKQQDASVLKARNAIVRAAKKKYRWLIFLDDDCMLDGSWFRTINTFLHRSVANTHWAIQGVADSFPRDNFYAQSSGLLYRLWFEKNTTGNQSLVLDTKCCALDLLALSRVDFPFDEALPFDAGDIDLSCRMLKRDRKNNVFVLRTWRIRHEERTRFVPFVLHRARLSAAFRLVQKCHPSILASEKFSTKIRLLWNLKVSPFAKITLTTALFLAQIIARSERY